MRYLILLIFLASCATSINCTDGDKACETKRKADIEERKSATRGWNRGWNRLL